MLPFLPSLTYEPVNNGKLLAKAGQTVVARLQPEAGGYLALYYLGNYMPVQYPTLDAAQQAVGRWWVQWHTGLYSSVAHPFRDEPPPLRWQLEADKNLTWALAGSNYVGRILHTKWPEGEDYTLLTMLGGRDPQTHSSRRQAMFVFDGMYRSWVMSMYRTDPVPYSSLLPEPPPDLPPFMWDEWDAKPKEPVPADDPFFAQLDKVFAAPARPAAPAKPDPFFDTLESLFK